MKDKKLTVHIVSHSHWDREWYLPFEIFRNRLTVLMERLFQALEKKEGFEHFTLDGQSIIIEDYLQRFPQNTEKLRKLIEDERIEVGPWYVLPDEFLIQGETFVRNYLVGQSVLNHYKMKSSQVGYLPDMFGHSAFTPTLLKGLGLKAAVLWRGPGKKSRKTEFLWQSENGDTIPTIHLIDSYSNAANFGMNTKELVSKICNEIEKISNYRTSDHILLMNGTDHEFPIFEIVDHFDEMALKTHSIIRHSTIEAYVNAVTQNIQPLGKVHGELKDATYEHILKNVLSSRIYLKLLSFEAQQLYIKYVEPLSALCAIQKPELAEFLSNEIREGWKLILQSLTHDGIGGCSTDRVHRKVEDRLADALFLGISLVGQYLRQLFPSQNNEIHYGDDYSIIAFNPDDKHSEKIVETRIPRIDQTKTTLFDENGNEIPYEVKDEMYHANELYETRWQQDISTVSEFQSRICPHKVMEQYSQLIRFKTTIPPLGFARFELAHAKSLPSSQEMAILNPFDPFENDQIIFLLNNDGSFNLTDKRNGQKYDNINRIIDLADIGDEYNFSFGENDQAIYVNSKMIQHINAIQTINGVEYSILILMPLPKDYDYAKNQRSQGTVQNKLKIIYKVYNDSSRVDIEIQLDNSAKDHKTCFEIAVPGKLETILKDSYYGLVKQKAAFYEYNDEMTEENLSHHAMEQLSALLDNGKGLMVVSRGIHEFESFHEGNFTKAHYTLVRSVGMLSKKSLNTRKGEAGPCIETPEAQCICRLIHQYAIIPLVDSDETVIMKEANQFLLKPVVICQNTSVSPDDLNQFKFSAMNTLFLKSLKISEDSDGLTARFLNLHNKNASVRFDVKNIKDYRTTNMAEISTKQLAQKEDNHMTINQIGSIKMQFKKQR